VTEEWKKGRYIRTR